MPLKHKRSPMFASPRLFNLAKDLRRQAPQWGDRLLRAQSERELLEVVKDLCNLRYAVSSNRIATTNHRTLTAEIRLFVADNLHKGLTLKAMAYFLGYSEKYCSELFRATMGRPFSEYLTLCRLEKARTLLATTQNGLEEIAEAIGYSDQFAFSRFFKRLTGQSPGMYRRIHYAQTPGQL
ncbi:hypothetical protein W02_32840 [Nitrospira sp. KM1]|uniref:helix-turn-helix transcriptional regulator n=1 Tax=Nitrospira sp. KM1 TaxID=1936990 RepID=UPI0013A75BD9|nr:helix-turn-helix transcriptional regulator [Nitrospira sp. KM1]BCA56144.1 hypothetical protein W02_32840 [Nitrospira sp. KM1]